MILRNVPGEPLDVQLGLEEEALLEVAREAHYLELEVQVSARSADKGSWSAVAIEFVQTSAAPARFE
jgi:hypothetical protein